MSSIPPLCSSVQNALGSGFLRLNHAAAEIVAASQSGAEAGAPDTLDVRSSISSTADPLLTGIRDLMLAKLQVGAGSALLHAYRENRNDLFEMLRS